MPQKCIVGGCGNVKTKCISLHNYPQDREKWPEWDQFVRSTLPGFKGGTETTVVCSRHFGSTDFKNYGQFKAEFADKLLLRKDAVPSKKSADLSDPTMDMQIEVENSLQDSIKQPAGSAYIIMDAVDNISYPIQDLNISTPSKHPLQIQETLHNPENIPSAIAVGGSTVDALIGTSGWVESKNGDISVCLAKKSGYIADWEEHVEWLMRNHPESMYTDLDEFSSRYCGGQFISNGECAGDGHPSGLQTEEPFLADSPRVQGTAPDISETSLLMTTEKKSTTKQDGHAAATSEQCTSDMDEFAHQSISHSASESSSCGAQAAMTGELRKRNSESAGESALHTGETVLLVSRGMERNDHGLPVGHGENRCASKRLYLDACGAGPPQTSQDMEGHSRSDDSSMCQSLPGCSKDSEFPQAKRKKDSVG